MLTDEQLQHRTLSGLNWVPDVTAAHLGVSARDGIGTLTGQVGSYAEEHAAESATMQVHGVAGVAENIKVPLPFDRKLIDGEIAAAAIDRSVIEQGHSANRRRIEMAAVARVSCRWIARTAFLRDKDLGLHMAEEVVGVEGLIGHHEIRTRIDRRALRKQQGAADRLRAERRDQLHATKAVEVLCRRCAGARPF